MPQPKVTLKDLDTAIARLDLTNSEQEQVLEILSLAKKKQREARRKETEMKISRSVLRLRLRAKKGIANVNRYLNFVKRTCRMFKLDWPLQGEATLVLLGELKRSLVYKLTWPLATGRLARGRQSEPWITEARKKLRKLGLLKADANKLLLAVGLSKHRPSKR